MNGIFEYQGFGALSEWNGQVKSASAQLAMQAIAATGANSIEIVPRIWTQTASSSEVISDPAKTESDASLIQGILNAQADGLKVILKPNISTLSGKGSSSIVPTDVGAFFASYKAEIVHLATIAEQTGVSVLAIGNEMSSLTSAPYHAYWTDIIDAVRQVYHGEVTYAAATDEAVRVSFWSELDAIGVNTYPRLTVPENPTVADIVDAWHQVPSNPYWAASFMHMSPVDFLHAMSEQYGKPVLMTEAGVRSIDYGTTITGSWQGTGAMDLQEQADAYAAFLQIWTSEGGPWLQGVEFWQWDLNNKFNATGFSPMGKPAQSIVAEYFKGAGPMVAAGIEHLSSSEIADLQAAGITTLVSTDHEVLLDREHAAALGAAHLSVSERYGSAGAQTLTWNADGTLHDIHYQAIGANGSYTDYDVVMNAAGQPAFATYANGSTASYSYNPDGTLHELILNNISGHPWTTTDTIYDGDGAAASEAWSKGAALLQTETWNADGSVHDIHYYGVTGQPYSDFDVIYGANGKPASATYSNGMTESFSYNADNSLHEVIYQGITGRPWTSTDTIYGANGQPASESRMSGTTLVQAETWNADGSVHDVHSFNITGQAYTDKDVFYGPSGKPAFALYSNGMTELRSYNADQSLHSVSYSGIVGKSYDTSSTGYEAGKAVVQEFGNVDGSHAVRGTADQLTFTASGAGVSVSTSGGDHFDFSAGNNAVLTGGGAGESFVFQAGFGQATITDFVPNAQATTNHDLIEFTSGQFAGFADLMQHAVQAGTATVITDTHGDKLTLQHVDLAHLTASDFLLS